MASFFVRNNTSGSSVKSISGAISRKEASDFNWLSNQFDDVSVDRCRLAWLMNENCSASNKCVNFSSSSTTQDSFI